MISHKVVPPAVPRTLDNTDREILRMLQEDAYLNTRAIAARVHRSVSPVHERIKRLQEEGYIKRVTAILDRDKIGRPLLAIVQVRLSAQTREAIEFFIRSIQHNPAVILCLQVSGAFDFLLHVAASDMTTYQPTLDDLSDIRGVVTIESHFVLRETKGDVAYPL